MRVHPLPHSKLIGVLHETTQAFSNEELPQSKRVRSNGTHAVREDKLAGLSTQLFYDVAMPFNSILTKKNLKLLQIFSIAFRAPCLTSTICWQLGDKTIRLLSA
jgi:hypothetical protein